MYQVIGMRKLLAGFAFLAALCALLDFMIQPLGSYHTPADLLELLHAIWSVAGAGASAAGLFLLLAETRLFAWACRFTPLGRLFPPIEGVWVGELTSNWSKIAARSAIAVKDSGPVAMEVYLKARLFTVGIETKSALGYSTSETVTVGIAKHGLKDTLRLAYVYEGKTPVPVTGDTGQHYGAAMLVLDDEGPSMKLDGDYWTNRNWTEGLNTAGRLSLRKETAGGKTARSPAGAANGRTP